jgi:hypothetical protein
VENNQTEQKNIIQWQPLIEMIVVLVTILGSTIPLYIHTDSKIDAMHETIKAINMEIKDFHTRLALQDQEFKMRLSNIEERNKTK